MKKILIISFVALISLGGFFLSNMYSKKDNPVKSEKTIATIYKSPSCGCCVGYGDFLDDEYDVKIEAIENMEAIKDKFSIPTEMESCHTTLIGDYFIEGHVPMVAVSKLLAERPDIDGISLPGMPAGSPGMPGAKSEEFVIYSIKNGETGEFMRI